MSALYFNEFDRYPAAWLRNLYPSATVDERSIADVGADDVTGYTRCHWFAGIAGWEYALDLAGWPADREVWTGSCPCQPFSAAGRGLGAADPRHLWPEFYRLIAERRPATVFGEQVGGAAGRAWLSAVRADLEAIGYAVGAADLCAAGVGAPHIRQRLYWVANADGSGRQGGRHGGIAGVARRVSRRAAGEAIGAAIEDGGSRPDGGLADALHAERWPVDVDRQDGRDGANGRRTQAHGEPRACGQVRGMADAAGREQGRGGWREQWRDADMAPLGHWADAEYLPCADGRARPAQPGVRPLAHGVPARASKLRAYGNAIVPQLAAVFIRAFMDCEVTT